MPSAPAASSSSVLRSLAKASVDPLAQQVRVTHVAGVLLDHPDHHLRSDIGPPPLPC